MRNTFLWAVAAAFAAVAPFAYRSLAQSPPAPAGLQAQVDSIFNRWNATTPGCAVAAAVRGQTVVRSAYGIADLERNIPNSPSTVFEAGSVAKQFTALAVLLLAREGKLSLDDPVHKYIPELPDYGATITIRQMLHHTSGLREWNVLATFAGLERGMFESGFGPILDLQRRQRSLNFPPGTRLSYSNSGYALAAMIVSRVSGKSFADFTASRMFQPLGMSDTSWQQDVRRVVKNRALGYSERQNAFINDMPLVANDGAGGLWTTVDDMLKWNDNFVRPVVGDAALIRELQMNAPFGDGHTHEYAMGLVVDTYRGIPEADHSGAGAGYRAYASRYPDQQVSIAVLCNSATANPTSHGKALAQLLLADALRVPGSEPAVSTTFSDADAERFAGVYQRSPQVAMIRIVRDGTALLFNGGTPLARVSETRLMRADNGDTLDFDGRGRARYVDEWGTADILDRVDAASPTVEQLRSLAGDYYSDEIDTTLRLAVEDDRLVLQRRAEKAALTPLFADAFSGPIGEVTGVFVVERDNSGRVTGLTLTHDRVWNLRFVARPNRQ